MASQQGEHSADDGCRQAHDERDGPPDHAGAWPEGPVPQQFHLDLTVPTTAQLDVQHERPALALGARLLHDRSDDPQEPLRVYADPAGHPFCIFVGSPAAV